MDCPRLSWSRRNFLLLSAEQWIIWKTWDSGQSFRGFFLGGGHRESEGGMTLIWEIWRAQQGNNLFGGLIPTSGSLGTSFQKVPGSLEGQIIRDEGRCEEWGGLGTEQNRLGGPWCWTEDRGNVPSHGQFLFPRGGLEESLKIKLKLSI